MCICDNTSKSVYEQRWIRMYMRLCDHVFQWVVYLKVNPPCSFPRNLGATRVLVPDLIKPIIFLYEVWIRVRTKQLPKASSMCESELMEFFLEKHWWNIFLTMTEREKHPIIGLKAARNGYLLSDRILLLAYTKHKTMLCYMCYSIWYSWIFISTPNFISVGIKFWNLSHSFVPPRRPYVPPSPEGCWTPIKEYWVYSDEGPKQAQLIDDNAYLSGDWKSRLRAAQ